MDIEYEATFVNQDKALVRERLRIAGATLIKPESVYKRVVFHLPLGHEINGGWLRVRDEGDKITMTLKIVDGDKIENQKEINLTIDNFEAGINFLEKIGAKRKAYQESKRELWRLGGVEITIDEWPFLEPFVEVEGKSEAEVKDVVEKIGYDYKMAKFCAVDTLYSEKYNKEKEFFDILENITFEMKSLF
jgi:adenylate cyclase class 2